MTLDENSSGRRLVATNRARLVLTTQKRKTRRSENALVAVRRVVILARPNPLVQTNDPFIKTISFVFSASEDHVISNWKNIAATRPPFGIEHGSTTSVVDRAADDVVAVERYASSRVGFRTLTRCSLGNASLV